MIGNLFSKRKNTQAPQNAPQQSVQQQTVTEQVVGATQVSVDGIVVPQTTIVEKNIVESNMEPVKKQDVSALTHIDSRSVAVLNHAREEASRIKQARSEE